MPDLFDPRWKLEELHLNDFASFAPPKLTDAEKGRVWKAYGDKKPTRVPVLLATNNRVAILDRRIDPAGLTFKEIFTDAKAQLNSMLHWKYLCQKRYHLFCDWPTEGENPWTIDIGFQNSADAMFFGCPVHYRPHEVPDTTPVYHGENKEVVFDIDISDPLKRPPYSTAVEFYEILTDYVKDKTFLGNPIVINPPSFSGSDGPLTIAMDIRGTEVLFDLVDDPEYAHKLFRFICDMALNRRNAFIKKYNLPPGGNWMADDSIAMISVDQYKEMLLPHHRYFYEASGSKFGQRSIHLCGDATRHFPTLCRELGVTSFDTGFPVDFAWLRKTLGPDVEIQGGVEVGILISGKPEQVYERSRQILTSGIKEGGRFIFREANNLPPNVPWENLAAMYKAAFDFGKY
jgi:uroporphyrinogen-III decarboxylase